MSIETDWKQLNEKGDEDLTALLRATTLNLLSSKSPLQKIKRSLLINIIFGGLICLIYVFVMLYFKIWQIQLAIGIVLLFSLWAVYSAYIQYIKIDDTVSSNTILAELKKNYYSIVKWIRIQLRAAVCIYPVSVIGGFMIGGVLGSGKPVNDFLNRSVVQIALVICILIMVPVAYYLAKRLFRVSFGKHLKLLKQNIDDLEKEM